MKQLAVGAIVAILAVLCISNSVMAQSNPEFKLGFKALADQIPDIVGQPLENEQYSATGDSTQRTTTGLMVWRKSDRWTAFTNGHITWILGPYGLKAGSTRNCIHGKTSILDQPRSLNCRLRRHRPRRRLQLRFPRRLSSAAAYPSTFIIPNLLPDVIAMDADSAGLV